MFKLPELEYAHPRMAESLANAMRDYYNINDMPERAAQYQHSESFMLCPQLPEGFIYSGHNIEHDIHPAYSKLTHDYRHNLFYDATNKKSYLARNKAFDRVLMKAPDALFDSQWEEHTTKPYRDTYIIHEYGVADSPEQVYEHYKFLADEDAMYFVSMTPISKAHQPADGGWRWHKWGPYIGNQKREGYEYLYDEPNIDLVYTYHLYRHEDVVHPFAESETFIYYKPNSAIVKGYTKATKLNGFNIDFVSRTVECIDDKAIHGYMTLAKLPDDVTIDNFVDWIETVHTEEWY